MKDIVYMSKCDYQIACVTQHNHSNQQHLRFMSSIKEYWVFALWNLYIIWHLVYL